MNDSNATSSDPLEEWRESASHWGKHAGTIRTMFIPVTEALIEECGIRPGHDVLDVAGGPGEPSLTIAEVVGPSGSVTCTDAIPEMVANAEREAKRRGLTNMRFRQATADALPFSDSTFDRVVSRFGIMFFPDPVAGAREMLRVLKRGGTLSLAVWGRLEVNPFSYVVSKAVARHVAPTPAPPSHDAFCFGETGVLAGVLETAGVNEVRERLLRLRIEAPISAEGFWEMRSEMSDVLRNKLAKLSSAERALVGSEVLGDLREFFPDGQMSFPAEILIVSGTKS